MAGDPTPGPQAGVPLRFGGIAARGAGLLCDAALLGVACLLVDLPFFGRWLLGGGEVAVRGAPPHPVLVTALLADGVLAALYGGTFLASDAGRTLGMIPFGLRAVRGADGGRVPFGTAMGRSAVVVAGALLVLVPLALGAPALAEVLAIPLACDLVAPAFDRRRRTLHDRWFGTVVLTVRAPGAGGRAQ